MLVVGRPAGLQRGLPLGVWAAGARIPGRIVRTMTPVRRGGVPASGVGGEEGLGHAVGVRGACAGDVWEGYRLDPYMSEILLNGAKAAQAGFSMHKGRGRLALLPLAFQRKNLVIASTPQSRGTRQEEVKAHSCQVAAASKTVLRGRGHLTLCGYRQLLPPVRRGLNGHSKTRRLTTRGKA